MFSTISDSGISPLALIKNVLKIDIRIKSSRCRTDDKICRALLRIQLSSLRYVTNQAINNDSYVLILTSKFRGIKVANPC